PCSWRNRCEGTGTDAAACLTFRLDWQHLRTARHRCKREAASPAGSRRPSASHWSRRDDCPATSGGDNVRSVFNRYKLASALFPLLASLTHAQQFVPHIGYVYPAGGQQGSAFQVVAGGQFLNGASNAFVSGDGVQVAVVEYNRPMSQKEFMELRDEMRALQ